MTTPVSGLARSGMVDMESNTTLVQRYPAHEAVPAGDPPFPAVILLHDREGLTPFIRGLANRIARAGFYVLAPDLYARPFSTAVGAPAWMSAGLAAARVEVEALDRPERPAAPAGILGALLPGLFPGAADPAGSGGALHAAGEDPGPVPTPERADEIIRAALAYTFVASEAVSGPAALVAFGRGAREAFSAACRDPAAIRAAVLFCPEALATADPLARNARRPILDWESLASPLLLVYGLADDRVPREEREAVAEVLRAGGKIVEILELREAGHDFFDPEAPGCRIAASRQAWGRMLAFLQGDRTSAP